MTAVALPIATPPPHRGRRAHGRRTSPRATPPARIPLSRIVSVELRKSFDTRSGFWLLVSVGVASVLATIAAIAFAPVELAYSTFILAIGFPMAILLPMIAILSVTGEWSQRNGLTTFTLVPHRGRVVLAKGIVTVSVAVASMLLAIVVGAVGNVIGSTVAGSDTVWDQSLVTLLHVVLANVLVLLVGFMLGVVIRNSAGAIVAYFLYSFVMPTLTDLLAGASSGSRTCSRGSTPTSSSTRCGTDRSRASSGAARGDLHDLAGHPPGARPPRRCCAQRSSDSEALASEPVHRLRGQHQLADRVGRVEVDHGVDHPVVVALGVVDGLPDPPEPR